MANIHIAQRIGVSTGTVRAWRKRFVEPVLAKVHRGTAALNQTFRRDLLVVRVALRPRFYVALPVQAVVQPGGVLGARRRHPVEDAWAAAYLQATVALEGAEPP